MNLFPLDYLEGWPILRPLIIYEKMIVDGRGMLSNRLVA